MTAVGSVLPNAIPRMPGRVKANRTPMATNGSEDLRSRNRRPLDLGTIEDVEGARFGFINNKSRKMSQLESLLRLAAFRVPSLHRRYIMGGCLCFLFLFGYALTSSNAFIEDDGIRSLVWTSIITIMGAMYCIWQLVFIFNNNNVDSDEKMLAIQGYIQEGSEGFFIVQYRTIITLALVVAACLSGCFFVRSTEMYPAGLKGVSSFKLAISTGCAFLIGAFSSAFAGYSGLWIAVRVNARVANAAKEGSYSTALLLCFRGGAVTSIVNISLAVGSITFGSILIRMVFPGVSPASTPLLLSGFGFGASFVAMFAQLGGGIYTKAADIGADLVGKMEFSIPEDDPRNPAVIADLVGDNVGDCAGQCADLFESISAEIISTMIIAGNVAGKMGLDTNASWKFIFFPVLLHSVDIIASSIGCLLVRTRKGDNEKDLEDGSTNDPLSIMIRAYLATCGIAAAGLAYVTKWCLYTEAHPSAWVYYYFTLIMGMGVAFLFFLITQYYTDYNYPKVRAIAEASLSGPATNIITGLGVGMESVALPVVVICVAVLISYELGNAANLTPGSAMGGLFGTATATMGMLSSAGFVLSMSSFGPIADNAGGIVEMTHQNEDARRITDKLDAVGNVTKANTKGFSVGSAALACFLLFTAFLDEVEIYSKQMIENINIAQPEIFTAGLLGAALVLLFSAWALEAVSNAAQETVKECRRQFKEYPEIFTHQMKPDYQTCVAISNKAALKEMIKPGLLAVLSPVVVGLVFKGYGQMKGDPLMGAKAVASFQMFATCIGVLMALFLNNAGGAWDNAKKYIETGQLGGKNSEAHKASVVGDTVGDPCKDTAGPSVHVLIKLVCTVTIVLTPIFI